MTRPLRVAALGLLAFFAIDAPALAYLKFGFTVGGRSVTLKWAQTPVRYFVTERGVDGVSAADLQAAVARAFATWQAVPTSGITYQFAGFTTSLPGEDDGRSTLGFSFQPDLERVLASTSLIIDDVTGELLDADIFFNSAFPWSVASGGSRDRWDVESIALHEIGHLSGLSHSAIGETVPGSPSGRRVQAIGAVMFPIALSPGDISERRLQADDIAGISDLYPAGDFARQRGSISGRVTKNGRGVFGAHIVAFDLEDGSLVAGFTLNQQGEFSIAGLRRGAHVLRVEPLDDADPDAFFDPSDPLDVDFRIKYFERLVPVASGGDQGGVAINVVPK